MNLITSPATRPDFTSQTGKQNVVAASSSAPSSAPLSVTLHSSAPVAEKPKQYLTFMLGGDEFAISILGIKEIIEYSALTEVPMMPECVRGVINLRGSVVPVMNLSARFGKQTSPVSKRSCIVIIELIADGECKDIGIVVDAVIAVLEISGSDIEAPPTFGSGIRTDFMEGIGKVRGKFVILLNINQVVNVDDITTAESTLGACKT